jgi:hypothetical protein
MPNGKALVLAAASVLAATASLHPARGSEPAHFAVMGVRLYMSAQEVLAALYAQGVREDGVTEQVHPCALHVAVACTGTITARLPDGPITIRFADAPPGFNAGREAAFSIAYRLNGGPSGADQVRGVAEERFGPLSDAADGAWCATATAKTCPPDLPRMIFRRTGAGVGELALTDLGLPSRLASGAAGQSGEPGRSASR